MKPNILFHLKNNNNYSLDFIPMNKFKEDTLFINNEKHLIILEGVITNSDEVLNNKKSIKDSILKSVDNLENTLNTFRGSFYLIYYNKIDDELQVFTDHWSSKFLYYSLLPNDEIIISDSLNNIYMKRLALNHKNSLNVEAAYMLLTFAYVLEDYTLEENTFKIAPGAKLNFSKEKKIKETIWYQFPTSEWDGKINIPDTIEEIDFNFRKCTNRQFKKDLSYGYKHLVSLSGGLDSRMVSWVGDDLGYTNQVNFTFSQNDYLDEILAKGMSSFLKHEWIFKSLDHGLYLKDIDNGNKIGGGNFSSMFNMHTNFFYSDINFSRFGIIHNGQNGEDTIGCPVSNEEQLDMKQYINSIGYSTKFIHKIPSLKKLSSKYNNSELLWNYTRCINGSNAGLTSYQQFSEASTPFLDIDFNEFCFSIPMKYRANHKLYKQWIITKYPEAAKFKWEKNNKLITYKSMPFKINKKSYDLKQFHKAILFKLGFIKPSLHTKKHMNPVDYWYKNDLKEVWDSYFNENISKLDNYKELKNDVIETYKSGGAIAKNQCLTLLSSLKLYFK